MSFLASSLSRSVLTLLRMFLARRVEKLSHSWRVLKVITRQTPRQGSGVIDDRYAVRVVPWAGKLQRREHEIPADQEERAGVAELHGCHLGSPRAQRETRRAR